MNFSEVYKDNLIKESDNLKLLCELLKEKINRLEVNLKTVTNQKEVLNSELLKFQQPKST